MAKDEIVYRKLARDKIPEILASLQINAETYSLSDDQYLKALHNKLREEMQEFFDAQNDEQYTEELADIVEVIHALLKLKGQSFEDLERIRQGKLAHKGGFYKRIFLEKTWK